MTQVCERGFKLGNLFLKKHYTKGKGFGPWGRASLCKI